MDQLYDEYKKAFEIEYPKDFPIEEFNKKIEKLIKENPQGVREKDLTDFLSDILLEKKDISLREFAYLLGEWTDQKLLGEIMDVKYGGILFCDIHGKIYRNLQFPIGVSGFQKSL